MRKNTRTVFMTLVCVILRDVIAGMRNSLMHDVSSVKDKLSEAPPVFGCNNGKQNTTSNLLADRKDYGYSNNKVTQSISSEKNGSFVEIQDAGKETTTASTRGPVTFDFHSKDCDNLSNKHEVRGQEGQIIFSMSPAFDSHQDGVFLVCDVELIVPLSTVAYVQIQEVDIMCDGIRIELRNDENSVMFQDCPYFLPRTFLTYTNTINLRLEMLQLSCSFTLHLNFTALPETSRPQLQINFTSPTTGYLATSNWQNTESYPPFVNSWIRLEPPEDYVLVINIHMLTKTETFCSFDLGSQDHVIFRTENGSDVYQLCSLNAHTYTDPLVFHEEVSVKYRSYLGPSGGTFKILFSFHHITALPVPLSDGRWNCSAVHWPDMQQHFPCNFVSECVGGEDEAGCWPASGTCGKGTVKAAGRCLFVLYVGRVKTSWSNENVWCHKRGGRLVSLSTRKLWDVMDELYVKLRKDEAVSIGARSPPKSVLPMYKSRWIWSDMTAAHFVKLSTGGVYRKETESCAIIVLYLPQNDLHLQVQNCDEEFLVSYRLCEMSAVTYRNLEPPVIDSKQPSSQLLQPFYVHCPGDHFTHVFLACDEISSCWSPDVEHGISCSAPLTIRPPPFTCGSGYQSVPYTLVCDHRPDCRDGSDEDLCYFPPCDVTSGFLCDGGRCVPLWERCDGKEYCEDGSDEQQCLPKAWVTQSTMKLQLPVKIDTNARSDFTYKEMKFNSSMAFFCPDSHFVCDSLQQVCLPVYLRCNGMFDCPGHEDEAECDSYTCPGFYRCRGSQVCVHESHLCDGVYQCPQRDDDMLCEETCPESCVCHGWAFVCSGTFRAANYSSLRYLDASGTSMTLADLENSTFLVHLSLVRCNLYELHEVTLHNLRTLDLSYNELTRIRGSHLTGLVRLQVLKISHNPLHALSFQDSINLKSLKVFDMSDVTMPEIDFRVFASFPNLAMLNLSGSQVNHVTGEGFYGMASLRVLDLRFCPVTSFPREIFQSLHKVETIYADSYKLCCPATLPSGFNVLNCHAPSDEVSSCDDLLRSNLYRVGLAIFGLLALAGNLTTLVYRLTFHRTAGNVGYSVFVTNLCVADFLMGVYLFIIGIAVYRLRGVFVWEDLGWRKSHLCKLAGFTCLLSSEVSILIIFLITLDRFLVVRFPFNQFHFRKRTAQAACVVSWLAGLSLAFIPLLPVTSHWGFYSQSSICFPLPTSRAYFPSRTYTFGVSIIMNFIIFLFIFTGQVLIYWSVRVNSISAERTSKMSKDMVVARRLITVAMSNFLCWFPVGLTAILASYDVLILGEVNVAIAIFVLPFNAALNPFLYTINIYLERRRRTREQERRKWIISQLKSNVLKCSTPANVKTKMTSKDLVDLIKTLPKINVLSEDDIRGIFQ